jgi:hypothetical protein
VLDAEPAFGDGREDLVPVGPGQTTKNPIRNGQALSYVYYENEPGRRNAAGLLTRDEARRIALNVANLPELVKRPQD